MTNKNTHETKRNEQLGQSEKACNQKQRKRF